MEEKICQSCGMRMNKKEEFGINLDDSRNEEYCCYCYSKGAFTRDETLEEMVEECIPFMLQSGVCKDAEVARGMLMAELPNLKRWKKVEA